jgi:hypothetical protein
MSRNGLTFQELTDQALKDVLKKYKQPVEFMASFERESGPCPIKYFVWTMRAGSSEK